MLARDVRRRWLQYGIERKIPPGYCKVCGKEPWTEVDHIEPVGARPRTPLEFGPYIDKMFNRKCQGLCKKDHLEKTNGERSNRTKKNKGDNNGIQ